MSAAKRVLAVTFASLIAFPSLADGFDQKAIDTCTLENAEAWRATVGTPSAEEQEILNLETVICRMFSERRIDELADTYLAETGIIMLDGAGIADGRDAQRELFKYFVSQGFDLAWHPVKARVSQSGDMAWAIGAVQITYPDGKIEHAKYTSIWEKIDGEWQNVVEMRNGNGELGAAFF